MIPSRSEIIIYVNGDIFCHEKPEMEVTVFCQIFYDTTNDAVMIQ